MSGNNTTGLQIGVDKEVIIMSEQYGVPSVKDLPLASDLMVTTGYTNDEGNVVFSMDEWNLIQFVITAYEEALELKGE